MNTQAAKKQGERVAYSLAEFSSLFGRDRSWAYKLASAGKVRVIRGFGKLMVPATEVERILGEGGVA